MAFEKTSDRVRQLIRENDQRAATDLLMQAFQDKNQQLFNIALVQQSNIKKLADQSAAGILSPDEINREQAKTNAALLHLSDEYARLYESDASAKGLGFPRWALVAAVALIALLVVGWLVKNAMSGKDLPTDFDLEVYLHGPDSEEKAIQGGEVNLRLGEKMLQSRLPLDADGRATFKDLLREKFRGDSVHLLYFPPKGLRYKITRQSAATLTGQNQTIRFALELLPDTTLYALTLRDAKGRSIPDAQITVDGNLRTTSDAKGYFQIPIPKPSGTTVLLVIEKNSNRLFEQNVTISSTHTTLRIE